VCGVGIQTNYHLKIHLLSKHTDDPVTLKLIEDGAKLCKCEVVGCRTTFLNENGLKEHMNKVHGGNEANKRFTCTFCGKTFWYSYKFKNHESLHQIGQDRPYSCDICGAKLKTEYSVKKHKRRFHSENNTK